jgi:hypothetical protein
MNKNHQSLNLATFFDSNYLNRALALIDSVESQTERIISWKLLALDQSTYSFLSDNKKSNWQVITIEDFKDPEVIQLSIDRPYREFCWSLSSILLNYLLNNSSNDDLVAYIDSDCYFFADIAILFDSLDKEKDFFIHEHNFPKNKEYLATKSGRFNVGVIGGKVSNQFKQCIEYWRTQVIDKCILDEEKGLCGDQTYLDEWPKKYGRLQIFKNDGIGAGPWNISYRDIRVSGRNVFLNKDVLVFYHFHALKYNLRFSKYVLFQPALNYRIPYKSIKLIYYPYIKSLIHVSNKTLVLSKEISFRAIFTNPIRNFPRFFWDKS